MAVMEFLRRLFGSAAKKKRSTREADTFRLLAEQSPDVINLAIGSQVPVKPEWTFQAPARSIAPDAWAAMPSPA